MITVHHLEDSRSLRILWLLEELGLEYVVKHYRRDPKTLFAPPELLRVHPLGKSPVITDGEGDGMATLAESGAILEYLIDTYGAASGLRPSPGTPERLRYNYWLHFAEGSAMPPLLMKLVFQRVRAAPMPFFARPIAAAIAHKVESGFIDPNLSRQAEFMAAELSRREWFAGPEFSAADIQMSYPVQALLRRAGLQVASKPLDEWLARAQERPAYRRASLRETRAG